jgi:hypothetical protein
MYEKIEKVLKGGGPFGSYWEYAPLRCGSQETHELEIVEEKVLHD